MNILLTGATGMCGRALLPLLLADERIDRITAMCRDNAAAVLAERYGHNPKLRTLPANLAHPDTLPELPAADALIHMAALQGTVPVRLMRTVNTDATAVLINRCENSGVKRFIFISSVNTYLKNKGTYGQSKLDAEKLLRESSLPHTILRPALIYGAPDDHGGLAKALNFIRAHGFMPVFGDGKALEQPIFIGDFARCLHELIFEPDLTEPLFLGGADALPYNELILILARAFDLPCRLIHLPVWPFKLAARLFSMLNLPSPLSPEQIAHQCEDLAFDISEQINLCVIFPN